MTIRSFDWTSFSVLCAACGVFVLILTSTYPDPRQQPADAATGRFYYFLSHEHYDVIYRLADKTLKESVTELDLSRQLARVNRASTGCGLITRKAEEIRVGADGTFVSIANQRVCGNSLLEESFRWRVSHSTASLQMYRASGSALGENVVLQ